MKIIKGDLIKLALDGGRHFDVIVHGCNCFNEMGAGIAKSIKLKFPQAYEADMATIKGDRSKLGTYTCVTVFICGGDDNDKEETQQHELTIVNAYTQYHYGRQRRRYHTGTASGGGDYIKRQKTGSTNTNTSSPVDYDAIRSVFCQIKKDFHGKRIAYPKIGSGLAGGDWNIISQIINDELNDEDHTLVEYAK